MTTGFRLPTYDVPQNALYNLQPINAAIDDWRKRDQQGVENERQNKLMDFRKQEMGLQQQRFGLEKRKADTADEEGRLTRLGKAASAIHQMPDGPQKAAAAQALMAGHADISPQLARYGVDPNDHTSAVGYLASAWGEYDPLARQAKQAQINQAQASTGLANAQAGNVGKTDDIREFDFAKKQGFAGSFEDWGRRKANTNASQNITWGTDDKGNYIPMQANRSGELVASKLPPNVAPVPSEVLAYRKKLATESADDVAKARTALPTVERSASFMLDTIKKLEDHPALPRMTGWNAFAPNVSEGANQAQALIDQVQGKTFLEAFNSIRGGGAITEAEGAKATAALSRLHNLRVGEQGYKEALADLRDEVASLRDLARNKSRSREPSATVRGNEPIDLGNGIIIRKID